MYKNNDDKTTVMLCYVCSNLNSVYCYIFILFIQLILILLQVLQTY